MTNSNRLSQAILPYIYAAISKNSLDLGPVISTIKSLQTYKK